MAVYFQRKENKMKEYLLSVVAVCAVCALVGAISVQGKMKKQINFVLSLAIVTTLVTPIFSAIPSIDDMGRELLQEIGEEYSSDGVTNTKLQSITSEALNRGIERALCAEFSLDAEGVLVESKSNLIGDELIFEYIKVTLSGRAVFADSKAIKRYIQKNLCEECEVILLAL